MRHLILRIGYLFCVMIAGIILLLWVWPVDTSFLRPNISPVADYEMGAGLIAALSRTDHQPEVADYCRSIFLTHGKKMEKAVVMYHGYTNCPRQYEALAALFFEKGYNVYVPRIPYHGLKDRINPAVGRLTLEDLMLLCEHSVDIAQGLGEKVTVLGLSLGGVLTSWNAQFRYDIDTAVILVPSLGWYYLPGIVKPLLNFAYLMPDTLLWWHPRQREKRPIPYSMYHKFSSRGMGHALMLSLSVLRAAERAAPLAKNIVVITTALDRAVDYKNIERLMSRWRRHGATIKHVHFPAALGIEHDVIDPLQLHQQTDIVYQKIFEMITDK